MRKVHLGFFDNRIEMKINLLMKLISCAVCGVAAVSLCVCLHAQEDAYVDARSGSQRRPDAERGIGHGGSIACGDGCVIHEPIKIELTKMIAVDTAPPQNADWSKIINRSVADMPDISGPDTQSVRTIEWTARIVNQTQETLYFPTSPSWTGDEQQVRKSRVILTFSLFLGVKCQGGAKQNALELTSSVALYGAVDRSSHVAPVEPGHWITVVGMGAACPVPGYKDDEYELDVSLNKTSRYRENGIDTEDNLPLIGPHQSRAVHWIAEGTWAPDAAK